MALTYAEQETFAADYSIQNKVRQAAMTQAKVVRQEGGAVLHHTLRLAFAVEVLSDPELWKSRIASLIADDADMTDTPSDAILLAAVVAAWDDLSGAPGPA